MARLCRSRTVRCLLPSSRRPFALVGRCRLTPAFSSSIDKLRELVLSAQDNIFEVGKLEALDAKMELYDKTFIIYNDALNIIRDELRQFQARLLPHLFFIFVSFAFSLLLFFILRRILRILTFLLVRPLPSQGAKKNVKSESQESDLRFLFDYLSHSKLSSTVDRNLLLVSSLTSKREAKGSHAHPFYSFCAILPPFVHRYTFAQGLSPSRTTDLTTHAACSHQNHFASSVRTQTRSRDRPAPRRSSSSTTRSSRYE